MALTKFGKEMILRGVIDPASLAFLKVGNYQREVQCSKYIRNIMEGLEMPGGVPNIEIGMRGGSFSEASGVFYLQDDCYVIDGLQRMTAAKELLKNGKHPTVGVVVHIGTTEAWETERFGILNMNRAAISPSVLIRNQATENAAVKTLYELTSDQSFVLRGRVSWDQYMERGQLIKGQTLLKTACHLHRRLAPGLARRRYSEMANSFLGLFDQVGQVALEENVKTFWQLIDECFNLRDLVDSTESAPYIKFGFLMVLASLFSDHKELWEGNKLTVSTYLRRKLAMFAIRDPWIVHLCGASTGTLQNALYYYLEDHLNKGRRRSNYLTKFEITE